LQWLGLWAVHSPEMTELASAHHIFRHVGKTRIHDGFIDSAAFHLRTNKETGEVIEHGLSVNWVEYFQTSTPQEALAPLRHILETKPKKRTVGAESRFALLNVAAVKAVAVKYVPVTIALHEEPGDPSHAMIVGYEAFNELVAEEIRKIIIADYAPPPRT
jgi:hypothetical protein